MDSLKNIFTVSDLRNRVLFTLGLLGVYRVGHVITVPGVNLAALEELRRQAAGTMFDSDFGTYLRIGTMYKF